MSDSMANTTPAGEWHARFPGAQLSLDTRVTITRSGEAGAVTGWAIYKRVHSPMYFVEYTSADGRAVEGWFNEDELTAAGGNDE